MEAYLAECRLIQDSFVAWHKERLIKFPHLTLETCDWDSSVKDLPAWCPDSRRYDVRESKCVTPKAFPWSFDILFWTGALCNYDEIGVVIVRGQIAGLREAHATLVTWPCPVGSFVSSLWYFQEMNLDMELMNGACLGPFVLVVGSCSVPQQTHWLCGSWLPCLHKNCW
jgi:hypothetical protein